MMKYIILFLLLAPSVFAVTSDFMVNLDNLENLSNSYGKPINPECLSEWNRVMGQQPEELIKTYCNTVNYRVMWLLGLISLVWLAEPTLRNWCQKNKDYNYLTYVYKWAGIGLLFMAAYSLYKVG